jgi:peptidoglycan-associated lipoprotein
MTFSRTKGIALMLLSASALLIFSCGPKNPAAAPQPPALATTTTPAAPTSAAPTITLRASSTTIDRGQNTTLTWETQNAATVRIEPGIGQVDAKGNREVNPTSSVTYTATASGPGGTATDTARITVNAPAAPPATTTTPTRPVVTADPLDAFRKNLQDIYFDYDQADIGPGEETKLRNAAAFLKQNPNIRITIEGHCDERGSDEYNIGLGDRRANAVKEFLVSQGVAVSRLNTVSYGEERPQCRDESEDCFGRNRRAAFAPIS